MAGIISGVLQQETDKLKPIKPLLAGALAPEAAKTATAPVTGGVNTVAAPSPTMAVDGGGVAPLPGATTPTPLAPTAPTARTGVPVAPTAEERAKLGAEPWSSGPSSGMSFTTQSAPDAQATSYVNEPQVTPTQADTPRGADGKWAPNTTITLNGKQVRTDQYGIPRADVKPFNPAAGDWGDYSQPQGDMFTGVRDGANWFRGVPFNAEHMNQGDASNPYGTGFGNVMRDLIPKLLSQLPEGDPERAILEKALAEAGGPLGPEGTGMAPGPYGRPPDTGTTDPTGGIPGGNPISRGPGQDPTAGVGDPNTTDPNRPPGSTDRKPWSAGKGIIDSIQGIDPQTIDGGSSYDPAAIADTEKAVGTGYDATGYTAKTHDENLSQAVDRITAADGPMMERARAQALQQANKRGLSNSSMAVESGVAAVLDRAIQIGTGDIQAGQFNVAQQNEALRFTADATNAAKQFTAAAQNQASMFNAGEANKKSLFAAEQANLAARFAAEMDQAAKEFNATAFNQAKQRYVDAINTALAAQQDAENLSARDERLIQADKDKAQASLDGELEKLNLTLDQRERESIRNMSGEMFNAYQAGISRGMLAEMEPEARQNWLRNYNAIWAATNYLPFDINLDAFPAANTPPPEGEPPPPGNPPPGGNPIGRGNPTNPPPAPR